MRLRQAELVAGVTHSNPYQTVGPGHDEVGPRQWHERQYRRLTAASTRPVPRSKPVFSSMLPPLFQIVNPSPTDITLPPLAGLAWNTSQLYTSGVLSVGAAALLGDYNQNGVVDAADYVVWRKGLGTTHQQSHYDVWRGNFGASVNASAGSTVPEPAALVLVAGMLTALAIWRPLLNARERIMARLRPANGQTEQAVAGGSLHFEYHEAALQYASITARQSQMALMDP